MPAKPEPETPSELIDAKIKDLDDWRGEMLSRIRGLTKQAVPEILEESKWRKASSGGSPVWSHDGATFSPARCTSGREARPSPTASLEDLEQLFNPSSEGNMRRAIDLTKARSSTRRPSRTSIDSAVGGAANSAAQADGHRATKNPVAATSVNRSDRSSGGRGGGGGGGSGRMTGNRSFGATQLPRLWLRLTQPEPARSPASAQPETIP